MIGTFESIRNPPTGVTIPTEFLNEEGESRKQEKLPGPAGKPQSNVIGFCQPD